MPGSRVHNDEIHKKILIDFSHIDAMELLGICEEENSW